MQQLATGLLVLIVFALGIALASATPQLSAAPASFAPQMGSANFALDWSVVGEFSGGDSASTNYRLTGTVGQMAANTANASTSYKLCTGFECVLNAVSVYLPIIRR